MYYVNEGPHSHRTTNMNVFKRVHCYVLMQSHRQKPSQWMLLEHYFPAVSHNSDMTLYAIRQAQNTEPDVSQIYSQFGIKTSATLCA